MVFQNSVKLYIFSFLAPNPTQKHEYALVVRCLDEYEEMSFSEFYAECVDRKFDTSGKFQDDHTAI